MASQVEAVTVLNLSVFDFFDTSNLNLNFGFNHSKKTDLIMSFVTKY